jgi:hypothetical protein
MLPAGAAAPAVPFACSCRPRVIDAGAGPLTLRALTPLGGRSPGLLPPRPAPTRTQPAPNPQVDSLKKSLTDASRQLSAQSRQLQQQVRQPPPAQPPGALPPPRRPRRPRRCAASRRPADACLFACLCPPAAQYQKSVTLASSISLLDDIQLVVDTPARIEAALAAQVGWAAWWRWSRRGLQWVQWFAGLDRGSAGRRCWAGPGRWGRQGPS